MGTSAPVHHQDPAERGYTKQEIPNLLARVGYAHPFRRYQRLASTAWNRYVSAGTPLYRSDPRTQGIIEAQGRENPFEMTTQMRMVWS